MAAKVKTEMYGFDDDLYVGVQNEFSAIVSRHIAVEISDNEREQLHVAIHAAKDLNKAVSEILAK
ncbi:hypothetical protein IDZ49_10290 [Francisella tularensis]|nr:hypothetical protein [Francisella tularensis]